MTIARRELTVKVVGQADAVGRTSIEDSFFLVGLTSDFVVGTKNAHAYIDRRSKPDRITS